MIEINKVEKKYKEFQIKSFNMRINNGEFISILGESGSGKSTLLNIISGIDKKYTGEVLINGKSVEESIKEGSISMVFQDSLLLPHLNVFENIAFGLKIKKLSKEEINKRVCEVSENLEIESFLNRYPHELSGGQKQRVSIGRALVMNPKLLLMDEPFSALDTKLREKLQSLVKSIQKTSKITILLVTHDREEAFFLSDRIGIMNKGILEQFDTPINLYRKPKNIYVGKFLGIENFIKKEEFSKLDKNIKFLDEVISVGLPSEDLRISNESGNFKGKIKEITFKIGFYNIVVEIENKKEIYIKQNRIDFKIAVGEEVFVRFREENLIFIKEEKKC
ncbi:putative spermidine/putrescine transport system ATP-binding protein [Cetobacterium ceti]|uniref:Putative spermidine/putrescine transport system ATP-binding protein n=1 Tax=Cetobacterium ceti TaxID=180163 RepID=A0A1T4K2H2_9FUSO|nr:ABC transporter ATP-binding protein [Cetobacterium ceti]SJZ36660.1 putative spermidine/putrescine transport system ATP-binding protein [Cetobacterium ceti]